MGIENVAVLLVIGVVLLFVGYRRFLRRVPEHERLSELADYEAASIRSAKDPYQAAADQANYRNYR